MGENLCHLHKVLIPEYTGSSKNLTASKVKSPVNKWANELNRAFSKEEIPIAKKHTKKCSTSLDIKEMQIKTMLKFHFSPFGMAIIKNTNNNKC
jgi:hypothetical protein